MELTPDILLRAYAIGIFPMAEGREHRELHWIDPEQRGVLPLERFHLPRKLRRRIQRRDFEVRCDSAFAEVIRACAEPADNRPETWINPAIQRLYTELHESGFAHSVECRQDGALVGGLYGVALGGAFFGESMFNRAPDASKVALAHLVLRLRKGGFRLLDTQFVTPHLRRFGVVEIPRQDYRSLLARAITSQARFPTDVTEADLVAFLRDAARVR
ncbi:MAG: leucyl/phenylalanyl-tRNA--protein transferase [Kiloniellales bacterium]